MKKKKPAKKQKPAKKHTKKQTVTPAQLALVKAHTQPVALQSQAVVFHVMLEKDGEKSVIELQVLPFVHIFKCSKCQALKAECSGEDRPDMLHEGAFHQQHGEGMGYVPCGNFMYSESYVNMKLVAPRTFVN